MRPTESSQTAEAWPLCTERIRSRALHMLGARTALGLLVWGILEWFYGAVMGELWVIRSLFVSYLAINALLFFAQRRGAMTPTLAWLDIVANLAPMAAATHWSGGFYSPVLPIFVIKIGNYGLVYSVQTGVRAFLVAALLLAGFAVASQLGLGPSAAVHLVPEQTRQRLTLGFGGFLFAIGCYGALQCFRELSDRERRLAAALEEQRQLSAQLLEDRERLRQLSQRLVEVSEATLQAVSRELHDDFGQAITAVRLDLSRLERDLAHASAAKQQLRVARQQLGSVLENVRNLAQVLRPAALDDLGLVAAVESYATRFAERSGIQVQLELPNEELRLAPEIELTLYRTLQESLTNVARHARAQNVFVSLRCGENQRVQLVVRDDGQGFQPEADRGRAGSLGLGIVGMRERAELYGGELMVRSRPGAGTEILLALPVRPNREGDRGTSVSEHYRAVG